MYPGRRRNTNPTYNNNNNYSTNNHNHTNYRSASAAAAATGIPPPLQPPSQPPSYNNNAVNYTASNTNDFNQQVELLIPAEVRMISGCHSEQTSADVSNVTASHKLPDPCGRAGGAATSALLEILYAYHNNSSNNNNRSNRWFGGNNNSNNNNKQLTFQQVLLDLRKTLAQRGYDQIPQLTSSRPLELQETPFSCRGDGNGICRALLVGINYCGQSGQLSGCHNDVFNMKKYLINVQGYKDEHILVLVDDGQHNYPNRSNIITALRQLVAQSVAGDSVYFHYSGHGGLLDPDWNSFKQNNKDYDETIYPLDHERSGQIRDFSLFNNFVKPMPAGVTVTCVFDCCHSGTVLELPYSFQPTPGGTIRMRQNMDSLTNLAFLYLLAGGTLPFDGLFANVGNLIQNVTGGNLEDYHGAGMDESNLDFTDQLQEAPSHNDDNNDFGDGNVLADDNDVDRGAGGDDDGGDYGETNYYDVPPLGVPDNDDNDGPDVGNFGDGDAGGMTIPWLDRNAADDDDDGGDITDCGGCLGGFLGSLMDDDS